MRAGGAGRRWNVLDQAALQRQDLGQLQVGNATLVKTLDTPDGLTFSVDLTFLSSRPELARVLANSFWMIYQPGPRRATADSKHPKALARLSKLPLPKSSGRAERQRSQHRFAERVCGLAGYETPAEAKVGRWPLCGMLLLLTLGAAALPQRL